VLRQGLRKSHTLLIVALCTSFDVLLIALGTAGTECILQGHTFAIGWLRCLGVPFLTAYGLRAFAAAWKGGRCFDASDGTDVPPYSTAMTAIALSAVNPHAYLDVAFLLPVGGRLAWPARGWFTIGAMAASALWFSSLGFGARSMRVFFSREIAWRVLDTSVGIVMLAAAAFLVLPR
jgi:L-lysine exporter family protein LysE/ArgO